MIIYGFNKKSFGTKSVFQNYLFISLFFDIGLSVNTLADYSFDFKKLVLRSFPQSLHQFCQFTQHHSCGAPDNFIGKMKIGNIL